MGELQNKTISAFIWSAIEKVGTQLVHFCITIVIARILSPSHFGLVGMLTFFTAIATAFLDSGFGQALIRKKSATTVDYSTVFYFNLSVGIVFYIILYFTAPIIADFYKEPLLVPISRTIFLTLVINSFNLIQITILNKQLNFKTTAKANVLTQIIGGIIGIVLAVKGAGVWALVFQTLTYSLTRTTLLWYFSSWRPQLVFSKESFKELFSFGSNLLFSNILTVLFNNIYLLIIGKIFSSTTLGYYTQAKRMQEIPTTNFNAILQNVSYPVLSTIQNKNEQLKAAYRRLVKVVSFINLPMMIFLIIVAKPFFLFFFTSKWAASIEYFQILCFIGILYPLNSINVNVIKVKGRSDLYLYLDIVKKVLIAVSILLTYKYGIKAMLWGRLIAEAIGFYIVKFYSGKLLSYNTTEYLKDISPNIILVSIVSIIVYLVTYIINIEKPFALLFTQIIFGLSSYLGLAYLLKLTAFKEIYLIATRLIKT